MPKRGLEYLRSPSKRGLDAFGGLALALASAPVTVGAAIASYCDIGEQPFFTQTRYWRDESGVSVRKVRSLPSSGVKPDCPTDYGVNDPRASCIGRWLRKSGIDETPQLWSVIVGRMSLVGIRPITFQDLERLKSEQDTNLFNAWLAAYQSTPPAITGLRQLQRKQSLDPPTDSEWAEYLRHDLQYLQEASLRLDIQILRATTTMLVKKVLDFRKNNSPLAQVS